MNPISIILTGSPVSANHMWRSSVAKGTGRPFTYMPTEAKNTKQFWQLTAQNQLKKQGKNMLLGDCIHIDIKFHFENKMRRDIDNYLKVALDALTGVVYEDDRQIKSLRAEKFYDPASPRIEILITP